MPKPGNVADKTKAGTTTKDAHGHIEVRRSKELIVALSGPVGAGVPVVKDELENELRARHYTPVHIKLSPLFQVLAEKLADRTGRPSDAHAMGSPAFNRIWSLQGLGNELRDLAGDDMAAQLAIKEISVHRTNEHSDVLLPEIEPKRVAYIIDQLKHPREVALLRAIYGDLFFMIGVLSAYEQRKAFLKDLGMDKPEAEKLIERDRKESEDNGQQLEKTLQNADFFINNSRKNLADLRRALKRFVGLIHGDAGYTPNVEERGMFAAYSAGLRSACLSRQVGASILDCDGNIISTGCNDVPKGGGGLYEPGDEDQRCVFKGGICYNDKHKDKLRREIVAVLTQGGIKLNQANQLADGIKKGTRVGALIEFSRAVHAEMDAIVGIARTGVKGIVGATLYTTVYPCHNCARHIVAAGISTVVFIEPYEKSLASELHDDAILQESDQEPKNAKGTLVRFRHFEGVSPQKFSRLFQTGLPRKDDQGKVIRDSPDAEKKEAQYLDDYKVLEIRVITRLVELEEKLADGEGGAA